MCSLWSKCSGLHKSSQNAFVKPNKDWCWLQWLWSGRWSVNYYSWSRLGPAWQRSTSIARLGVKYVSIRRCCRTFHATQQFTIQQPSPTAVAVEGTCTSGMFGFCSWTTFKTQTFLQLRSNQFCSSRPSISLSSVVSPDVSTRVPRVGPGTIGPDQDLPPAGGRHQLLKDKMD